jgi:hypothetical protein
VSQENHLSLNVEAEFDCCCGSLQNGDNLICGPFTDFTVRNKSQSSNWLSVAL